ncbi:MAG: Holliday junction branch migration protein RuvA, partial [Dermacoccus nishinomiyaensis]
MIASLTGEVLTARLDSVVVEVGGVGLLVHTTPATAAAARPGESMRLATSLVVREDSLTLFGFADDDERALFEQVQTVSGVGPRLALAICHHWRGGGLARRGASADGASTAPAAVAY